MSEEKPIAEMDMRSAEVMGVEVIRAARHQYWTRGGIACEGIFLSHEALRAALKDLFDAYLNEMAANKVSHEWAPDSAMAWAAKILDWRPAEPPDPAV